jgi:D-3-phosphoglycerate dehydrogenase
MRKQLQVVVLDDGYESYTTEQSILAEIGAALILKPCHNDAMAVAAALVDSDAG